MAAADHGGPCPDLYQLLGVPRGASREEIALAWRRRARAEHPDSRPRDAAAPGRFRALAEAWQVLGDPARRAAYDRALAHDQQPADPAPVGKSRQPGSALPRVLPAEPFVQAGGQGPLRCGQWFWTWASWAATVRRTGEARERVICRACTASSQ